MTVSPLFSVSALALALTAGAAFAEDFDISQQIGPDPVLPEPSLMLVPDNKVAKVIGWKEGEAPSVPEGLAIAAYARDLANPRTVHTLPKGVVVVVQWRGPDSERLSRPKDAVRGWIMALSHGDGGPKKESNTITLLRDGNRDGTVDERHDL